MIEYRIEPDLTVDEFIDVLVRSTLAERRPVDERDTIQGMLAKATITLTGYPKAAVFAFCLLGTWRLPPNNYSRRRGIRPSQSTQCRASSPIPSSVPPISLGGTQLQLIASR